MVFLGTSQNCWANLSSKVFLSHSADCENSDLDDAVKLPLPSFHPKIIVSDPTIARILLEGNRETGLKPAEKAAIYHETTDYMTFGTCNFHY